MMQHQLKIFLTLLTVGLLTGFQWGCGNSSTPTSSTNNNGSGGVPMASLFGGITSQSSSYAGGTSTTSTSNLTSAFSSAFSPAFSSVSPFASGGTGTWAIGMIMGMDFDNSNLTSSGSPVSFGYGMVDLSVANQAVSTATVTLTPAGGTAISLAYLGSASYNGYNFAYYGSGSVSAPSPITYTPNTAYTMTVANIGDTATSSLTVPGGYGFAYSSGEVTDTIANPGSFNAAIAFGVNSAAASLTYQSTSPSGNPFVFPASAYSMSAGTTYISLYETAGWTTTVNSATGIKGGLIGADLGITMSKH